MADTTTHVYGKSTKTEAKFYSDAKEYWDGLQPTIDAMLGGYAKISPTDIDGSRAFLRPFMKVMTVDIFELGFSSVMVTSR